MKTKIFKEITLNEYQKLYAKKYVLISIIFRYFEQTNSKYIKCRLCQNLVKSDNSLKVYFFIDASVFHNECFVTGKPQKLLDVSKEKENINEWTQNDYDKGKSKVFIDLKCIMLLFKF